VLRRLPGLLVDEAVKQNHALLLYKTARMEWVCCRYTRIMSLGRLLIALGIALVAAGLLVSFAGRLPVKLGHLPGDIYMHGRNSSFYFPVTTCIVLSALFSLVLWFLRR
jgi:hypothetical protein